MKLNANVGPADFRAQAFARARLDFGAEQFSLMKVKEQGGAAWVGALGNHFCLPWAEKSWWTVFILLPLEEKQAISEK